MRLYLARHAETTWNLAGRYQGRRESALSARGIRQGVVFADTLAAIAPPIGRIVASPLLRTRATALFVAERLNVPVEADDALIEIEHGVWNGRLRDEIAANDPELYRTWRERPAEVAFPDGEALTDVLARWRSFRERCTVTIPTLVVTHDAVVRVALCDILERPLDDFWKMKVDNAGYAIVDVAGGRWTLVEQNVNAHLADLRTSTTHQAL